MIVIASKGANDISQERLRQIASEGYDAAHDDEHTGGLIAMIAAELATRHTDVSVGDGWGFRADQWGLAAKHPDTRRRLVIAGALIAAEIDRLDRAAGGQRR